MRRELDHLESHGLALAIVVCGARRACDLWLRHELRARVVRADACGAAVTTTLRHWHRARPLFAPTPRGLALATRAAWIAAKVLPRLTAWKPDWIHAQFIGLTAATACVLSDRLHVPLSVSAHARDIFVPAVRLAGICNRARFVATCSAHAHSSLVAQLPPALAGRVVHVPHDVACPMTLAARARSDVPLRLLSICRLVPKKGIDVVLRALALVADDVQYRYRIVGDGPELERLRALARDVGVDAVEFVGAVGPESVRAELADADVFVLGARQAADGDRDGIPNAMLEAMAAGVAVVVSDAGAVSEAVQHRITGWLPRPDDPPALAAAIREAAVDPVLRRRVATQAHAAVRRRFSPEVNGSRLAHRLLLEMQKRRPELERLHRRNELNHIESQSTQ